MKLRLILLLTPLFWSSISSAAVEEDNPFTFPWVLINETDELSIYLNVETIKDIGSNKKQAWEMTDYKAQQTLKADLTKFQSVKTKNIYDCRNETVTSISYVIYEEPFGQGKVTFSSELKLYEQESRSIVPDTVGESLYKLVCE